VADELSQRERALRRLPLPYSLALRLRDADISADVICQYTNVEQAALDGLYRIAEAKLLEAQKTPHGRDHDYHWRSRPHHIWIAGQQYRHRPSFRPQTTRDPCRLGRGQARTQDRN